MAGAALKTPFFLSLDKFAQGRISDAFQQSGKALPAIVVECSGSIVTVAFQVNSDFTLPQVTMPLAGSEYVRLPIQPGCKGVCFPADVSISGMSGLGDGVPSLTQPANLSALTFFPIGNVDFADVDPDQLTLSGFTGVTLENSIGGPTSIEMTATGLIMTSGAHTIEISPSGIFLDGVNWLEHIHSGGTLAPSGDTGPVIP